VFGLFRTKRPRKSNQLPTLCVLGMFRSGTNFAKAVFELNYQCLCKFDAYGWKHSFFPIISPQALIKYPKIPIVAITRNPLLALSSLQTYAASNKRNVKSSASEGLSEFLRREIVIFNSVNDSVELWFPNPVIYWASMTYNLVSVTHKRPQAFRIHYEELVSNPEQATRQISSALKLERKQADFSVPAEKLKNLGSNRHDSEKFFMEQAFDTETVQPDYYLNRYTQQDLDFVRQSLDDSLLERLGYDWMAFTRAGASVNR
jgi:hypothetical protein